MEEAQWLSWLCDHLCVGLGRGHPKKASDSHAECNRKVFPIINTCLDNVTQSANKVNPTQDNQQLVEDIKTGFPIPGDLAIEEYRGKENESEIWYETCHQMYPVGVEICILHT
ncbi:hypothetical protein EMCRGX_G027286 [Ephydatia muelleri]